jgi:hypothetical protein
LSDAVESCIEPSVRVRVPHVSPRSIRVLVGDDQTIVPRVWRHAFLGERWIAGRPCVVARCICSTELLVDVSFSTLCCEAVARYSYVDAEAALLALRDWDGRLDPPGPWTKEMVTRDVGPGAFATLSS